MNGVRLTSCSARTAGAVVLQLQLKITAYNNTPVADAKHYYQ